MNKKAEQLGMNPSTAVGRLVKDLLFRFVVEADYKCFRCGKELTRETFSIDHIIPWLDSDDPIHLYFHLENVTFSHHSCNSRAGRKVNKKYFTPEELREVRLNRARKKYTPEKRRERYLRNGT